MVRDIFVEELAKSRRGSFEPADAASWTSETSVRADGLNLDSIERMTLAYRLNETFRLYRSGVEDNLLRARTLGDTVEVVAAGMEADGSALCFYSGGSTGSPKVFTHHAESLLREIDELAARFSGRRRVVVAVPVHHIYGFLFGVLLPDALGAEPVDAQHALLSGERRPRDGDLLAANPFLWDMWRPISAEWAHGVVGVSSTAPLPHSTAEAHCAAGLAELHEIFGSSETAGIGARRLCGRTEGPAFTLFSYLRRAGDAAVQCGDQIIELPDRVEWLDDRRFLPRGRRDSVVQVAGHNVDLDALRRTILNVVPEASDCALRLGYEGRIRAFIEVPDPETRAALDSETITKRIEPVVSDAAIPRSIVVGAAVPRTPTGKLAEW